LNLPADPTPYPRLPTLHCPALPPVLLPFCLLTRLQLIDERRCVPLNRHITFYGKP